MKKISKKFLFFLFVISLIGCDPVHNLNFINTTEANAKVKINLKPETEGYKLRSISIGDSIVFNLKQKDTASIYYGIGTWSDKDIDHFANSIKNIEIETSEIKTIYKTKKSIKNILKNNIEGFWFKTDIIVEIE